MTNSWWRGWQRQNPAELLQQDILAISWWDGGLTIERTHPLLALFNIWRLWLQIRQLTSDVKLLIIISSPNAFDFSHVQRARSSPSLPGFVFMYERKKERKTLAVESEECWLDFYCNMAGPMK